MIKKFFAIMILLIISCNISKAQYVLISLIGDDCVKCRKGLEQHISSLNFVPYYFLFEQAFKSDISSIKEKYLHSGDKVVFSNKLFSKKKLRTSSIIFINEKGENEFEESIVDFNAKSIGTIKDLFFRNKIYNTQRPKFTKIKDGWMIKINPLLNDMTADSGNNHIAFKIDKNIEDELAEKFKSNEHAEHTKKMMLKYPNLSLKPKVSASYFEQGNAYYLVTLPFIKQPTKENIKMGAPDGAQSKLIFIYKVNKTNIPTLLEFEKHDEVILEHDFYVLNDKLFFIIESSKSDLEKVKFISEFQIKNNKIIFTKRLNNNYDKLLFEKNIGLSYLPGFRTFSYPYFIPSLSTKIANIQTEHDHFHEPIFQPAYIDLSLEKLLKSEISGESIPFNNRYLLKGKNAAQYYLITIVDTNIYFSLFNNNNDKLNYVSSYNLKEIGLDITHKSYFDISENKELLMYEDNYGDMRSVDLDIIMQ